MSSEFGQTGRPSSPRERTGLRFRPRGRRILPAQENSPDASRDPRCGVLDRIPGKMSVPRGRLHLRVTEQFPDHREAQPQGQSPAGIRVSEIMNSHVGQTGALADAPPGTLEVGEMGARQPAGDDPGAAVLARQVRQHGAGHRARAAPPVRQFSRRRHAARGVTSRSIFGRTVRSATSRA